jgi:hypothetical protein
MRGRTEMGREFAAFPASPPLNAADNGDDKLLLLFTMLWLLAVLLTALLLDALLLLVDELAP